MLHWEQSEHILKLRQRSEELRKIADNVRFRETRADIIAVAESYNRLVDDLDAVAPTEADDALLELLRRPH